MTPEILVAELPLNDELILAAVVQNQQLIWRLLDADGEVVANVDSVSAQTLAMITADMGDEGGAGAEEPHQH
ncbi:MAG: hypothetical protein IT371_11305 [Deltaproteobacteria bacterium]|nr:hypothetical protein [Deltaproteobacteria bacterium]